MNISVGLNEFLVACAFLPVLLATGLSDLRYMKIPNYLSFIGLGLFIATIPFLGIDVALARVVVGAVTFVLCFGLFAFGWLGGGDAKILPVTLLFVPISILPVYLLSFAACMILGMVGIWGARQVYAHDDAIWVSMKPDALFPMGISIAASLPLCMSVALLLSH